MHKKYLLGIDMGSAGVGWAVTDLAYRILRSKGKDLWGVREFEIAKTSATKRTQGISRRRADRDKVRRGLLRLYFEKAIMSVDPLFFVRLDNSRLYSEDKDERLNGNIFTLFNDVGFSDKEYHEKYETVFHLRKALLENSDAPYDVRLVYIAINSMFKHRGHFLLSGVGNDDADNSIDVTYSDLTEKLLDYFNVQWQTDVVQDIINCLSDKKTKRSQKLETCQKIIGVEKKDKKSFTFLRCLCGYSVNIKDLFGIESEECSSICFNDYSFSDKTDMIQDTIGDNNYQIIEAMKEIYDKAAFVKVLGEYDYLSIARCEMYKKHKEDLKLLKACYCKYLTLDDYNHMFRLVEDGSYSAYVNSTNSNGAIKGSDNLVRRNMKKPKISELYDRIKKDLKGLEKEKDVAYILSEIELENFLPKQITGANGVIPNQVHAKELKQILKNAEGYLPFLLEKDESGLTVSDRIYQLFTFQIPYYIGPTSVNSKNGWVIRTDDGKGTILPWNLEQKVDISKTSEVFIKNLIRTCTYLNDEKVLPKSSLLYERYSLLNEINNLEICGERISVELKQEIYTNLFGSGKRVTKKQICDYLIKKGIINYIDDVSGIDKNCNNSLSSYQKMYAIFGDKLVEDKYYKCAEDIIYYGTIYGDSKTMFRKVLQKYIDEGLISDDNAKRIVGYKFRDWGRLSKELLELQGVARTTGEITTIIRAMWDNNLNFIELINSNDFDFKERLEKKKTSLEKTLADFELEDLSEYYFSAPVRRMMWQTILLIREIVEVQKGYPEKIFIEMTRTDEEKGDAGRKNSREKQLLDLYKNISNTDIHDWKKEIEEAGKNGRLRSKKLFLYYLQMGKDMYTGEDIDLENLFTTDYDVDHIYPRHYVKDDSLLNNLVLVNKRANEDLKKDIYPIPKEIYNNEKVRNHWKLLREKNLINEEKYKRLTSRNAFTEDQLAGFISRQLVETSQATKGIATLINQLLPETTVVYSKASNVSDFRRDNKLVKSRIANEFHHAHDAYLNIVVGNVYYNKFTLNPYNFISKEYAKDQKKNHYNLDKMFAWDVVRNGYWAWKSAKNGKDATIHTVKAMLNKQTPIVTKKVELGHGEMYNIMPLGKREAKEENYARLKDSLLVSKYGGYSSLKPAYFIFLEHGKEGKRKKTFSTVYLAHVNSIKTEDDLIRYCEKYWGYENPRIICDRIKKYTKFKINGFFVYITGFSFNGSVEFHNATNMMFSFKEFAYINKIEKYITYKIVDKDITYEENMKLYDLLMKKHSNGIFKYSPKAIGDSLKKGIKIFEQKEIEAQIKILYDILTVSTVGPQFSNLKVIGGSSESGRLRFSGNMTNCEELIMYNESVTGLYEKKVDLMKL